MNSPRESIFESLLAQIATATLPDASGTPQPAFVLTSRKYQQWDQVPAVNQPAAFLVKGFEHASQSTYGETKWRLKAILWIYCQHSPDPASVPGASLNSLLDSVETALRSPDGSGRLTLGDQVVNAYIDGEILVSEGSLPADTQSIAVVPILIDTGI